MSETLRRDCCDKCGKIIPTGAEHDALYYKPASAYSPDFCWQSCVGETSICSGPVDLRSKFQNDP